MQLLGLEKEINVQICPTLRESDGLAMSSRNMRLNAEERKKAGSIYKTLQFINKELGKGKPGRFKKWG